MTKETTNQQSIDQLRETLEDIAKDNGEGHLTGTERMRAALALAGMGDAVAEDGTPRLSGARIDSLRRIINGEID